MEIEKIEDLFRSFEDNEYFKFDRVENKLSNRPDLHAFMLLASLFPGTQDIILSAEHDEVFLSITKKDIESLTEFHICELVRCGVRIDEGILCLFI